MRLSVTFGEDTYWIDNCTKADMHYVVDALETVSSWRGHPSYMGDPNIIPIDLGDESV